MNEKNHISVSAREDAYTRLADVILVYLDTHGVIEDVSDYGCTLLGYARGELVGKNWFATCLSPDIRDELRRVHAENLHGSAPAFLHYTNEVITRCGERKTISWHNMSRNDAQGLPLGTVSSGIDITERTQAEQAEKNILYILDNSLEHIYLVDPETRKYLWANQGALRRIGYTLDELRALTTGDTNPVSVDAVSLVNATETMEPSIERALSRPRERVATETIFQCKNGSLFPASACVQVATRDAATVIVIFANDTTQEKLLEKTLRDNNAELERMRGQLEAAARMSTLGEIGAGIAHEINQPLTAIANYAQACSRLLDREVPDAATLKNSLEKIKEQALRAGACIHRLRDRAATNNAVRRDSDINTVIQQTIELVAGYIHAHALTLQLELAPGLPQVKVDELAVQQVLLNLIRNGIEAMEDKQVTDKMIRIRSLPTEDGYVQIVLTDQGGAVAAEHAVSIFEPFFSTKLGNLGLGLAICRSIINNHGGSLKMEASDPGGATFSFTLPVAPPG